MGATLGTWLLTWLRGEPVGTDEFGKRYYRLKNSQPQPLGGGRFSRERRWVIYKGEPEGSKVPPEWHAWLHHMYEEFPTPHPPYAWKSPNEPNLTGTLASYHPRGSVLRGRPRDAPTGDCQP